MLLFIVSFDGAMFNVKLSCRSLFERVSLHIVVAVVALLFNVHGKHLRSCRDGQST